MPWTESWGELEVKVLDGADHMSALMNPTFSSAFARSDPRLRHQVLQLRLVSGNSSYRTQKPTAQLGLTGSEDPNGVRSRWR